MLNPTTLAQAVLMIRPAAFGPNPETAETNAFQSKIRFESGKNIRQKALREFDAMVEKMDDMGIGVIVEQDSAYPEKPDAIFPNNWFSTHPDGTAILYPMLAKSRRKERKMAIIENLKTRFQLKKLIDLSPLEQYKEYLEGTGSLVLDNALKRGYASLSGRTTKKAIARFESKTGYRIITFEATEPGGRALYHTNVMMSLTQKYAAVCTECVRNETQRQLLLDLLQETKKVVPLSWYQITQFAGNMLQLKSKTGQPVLVASTTAWASLETAQQRILEKESQICTVAIPVIEQYGGGSARCMIAEIFLTKNILPNE